MYFQPRSESFGKTRAYSIMSRCIRWHSESANFIFGAHTNHVSNSKSQEFSFLKVTMQRKENFTIEEKALVVQFVSDNRDILENKANNTRLQKSRRDKWMELTEKMATTGIKRDWKDIRGAYQRWKLAAKKTISCYRKHATGTGGGPALPESSGLDFTISEICPEDFVEDENPHDSDSLRRTYPTLNKVEKSENEVTYELDPTTGELVLIQSNLPQADPSCSTEIGKRSHGDRTSPEPVPKKIKKNMTAYEVAMLELQTKKMDETLRYMEEKHNLEIQIMKPEHDLRMEILKEQLEKERFLQGPEEKKN
ncbi:uncharacterized protein LOC107271714 isoform X1 [Cephus cinctus]|uniref:Regulatory protein zeste n=2 Tax=Cephus cinctus TaxID=211228 RepID=A0AAJ7C7A7_CEPCN|nr:uncharacterized protein LOC107271714 isoform X1 [Cephus cinctus]